MDYPIGSNIQHYYGSVGWAISLLFHAQWRICTVLGSDNELHVPWGHHALTIWSLSLLFPVLRSPDSLMLLNIQGTTFPYNLDPIFSDMGDRLYSIFIVHSPALWSGQLLSETRMLCAHPQTCVCCGGQGRYPVSCSITLYFSLILELDWKLASFSIPHVPSAPNSTVDWDIRLSPHLAFHVGTGKLNLDPHACVANGLTC